MRGKIFFYIGYRFKNKSTYCIKHFKKVGEEDLLLKVVFRATGSGAARDNSVRIRIGNRVP